MSLNNLTFLKKVDYRTKSPIQSSNSFIIVRFDQYFNKKFQKMYNQFRENIPTHSSTMSPVLSQMVTFLVITVTDLHLIISFISFLYMIPKGSFLVSSKGRFYVYKFKSDIDKNSCWPFSRIRVFEKKL